MIISLCGFMGSGKSSVGAVLASKLGWRFTDLDRYVEHKAAKSIGRIFSEDGQDVFRALEAEAVRDRIVMSEIEGFDLVLALGGGTMCINPVRPYILEHTRCVWLKASASTILSRLEGLPEDRPLFDAGRLDAMLAEREPLYALASDCVCTDALSVDQICSLIVSRQGL